MAGKDDDLPFRFAVDTDNIVLVNPETDENAPHKQLMTIADATAKALNEHGVPALELQGHILTNKKMMTEAFNNLACTHGVCPF